MNAETESEMNSVGETSPILMTSDDDIITLAEVLSLTRQKQSVCLESYQRKRNSSCWIAKEE